MKRIFVPVLALVLTLSVGCNNANTDEKTDHVEMAENANEQKAENAGLGEQVEDDHEFMVAAASGGLMEVELGKMASDNAASAQVKQFGRSMVTDHGKANEELKALAAKKNITIPAMPGNDHEEEINDLKTKKGADFDKAYMNLMVKAHNEDVNKFEEAANGAKDPEIKAFAAKTLPVLKQHHEMAKKINDGLK